MTDAQVRVVIADDEAIIRLDLKEILEEAGFSVVAETGRGDEVIGLVDEHTPDLVILDIKMPGLDGVSAARTIREKHDVPIMLLTAFSQRDLIQDARDAGVAAYLVKPFRKVELIPAVNAILTEAQEDRVIAADLAHEPPSKIADDKLETRRLVDQAKAILIERDAMSEEDAFGFIQKTAMQSRRRMRDIAASVVDGTLTPS
jgi:two-component system, response regulator PdtaR